ncbi:MAG: hypothetical protein WAM14_07030 [Candidatus Nitrosopolaris sp.]
MVKGLNLGVITDYYLEGFSDLAAIYNTSTTDKTKKVGITIPISGGRREILELSDSEDNWCSLENSKSD